MTPSDSNCSRSATPLPYSTLHTRKYSYDTLKVEHHAHGAKTSDPVINTEKDEQLILRYGQSSCAPRLLDYSRPGCSLRSQGLLHETELSLFLLSDYLSYKDSPDHGQTSW